MKDLLLAGAVVVVLAITYTVVRLTTRRPRWTSRTRAATGNRIVVEVFCPGQPAQVVAELDPAGDGFDENVYEAQSRADELSAMLNAAR